MNTSKYNTADIDRFSLFTTLARVCNIRKNMEGLVTIRNYKMVDKFC